MKNVLINKFKTVAVVVLLILVSSVNASAQTIIKGKVVNSTTKAGFAGARITLVGTTNTTMSDESGTFELKVNDLRGVLNVEAPGFDNQLVGLKGVSCLFITMLPESDDNSFYDEKALSTQTASSTSRISNSSTSSDEDFNMRLSGTMRSISHSGLNAGGAAMFIRGLHSLNMSSQPLIIVDGVIWQSQDDATSIHSGYCSNPLALIMPDDVESVSVLKDGTALYGSKGGNGVIIIKTKRSHNMATEITANISYGFKSKFKSMPMMDAGEYRLYASDIMSGMKNINTLSNTLHFLNDDKTNSYYMSSHNNTDWMDEINKSAFTQKYGVSVRGGDEIALYSFSLGYAMNNGNIDKTDFDRLNVRFNSDILLTKKLNVKMDIAFAQISRDVFNDGIDEHTSPLYMALIKSPLYNSHQFDTSGNLYKLLSDKDELGIGNPLALTSNADGKTKNYRFTAKASPTYKFNDNFSLTALVGYSWDKIKENSFTPDFGLAEVQLYNDQNDWYGEGDNNVTNLMSRYSSLTLDIHGDWKPVKSYAHNLSILGGFRFLNDTFESDYGSGYNTGSDNLRSLSVTSSSLRTTGGANDNWRTLSWYASADYNYLNRYFLSASATMESSSRFGKQADNGVKLCGIRWGLFPSINGAWVMTNEKFMRNAKGINYLKIHAGYNIAGNDDLPSDATRTYFTTISYTGLAKGLQLANIGNDKLEWETTSTANAGFDISLLNNRLSVSADFFLSATKNLLVQKQLSEESGMKYYWTNDGRMTNKGFDVTVKSRIIDTKDITLNAGVMVGHYNNRVTDLENGSYTTTVCGGEVLTSVNHPAGVFYGYKTAGVFSTQAKANNANLCIISDNGEKVMFKAGDMHFVDVDNNGIINENDKQIIGDPNPDIYGNINLDLRYKRFNLNAIFTYSLGNDAYNALRATLESGSSMYNQTESMCNRWVADGQITDIPRAIYDDPMGNSRFSDRWIEDASYLRFKQLTVSYSLPIKPKFIQGASVWASVTNLFTITKYLGMDPEFSYGSSSLYQGVDAGLIPSARSFRFGVKFNL